MDASILFADKFIHLAHHFVSYLQAGSRNDLTYMNDCIILCLHIHHFESRFAIFRFDKASISWLTASSWMEYCLVQYYLIILRDYDLTHEFELVSVIVICTQSFFAFGIKWSWLFLSLLALRVGVGRCLLFSCNLNRWLCCGSTHRDR